MQTFAFKEPPTRKPNPIVHELLNLYLGQSALVTRAEWPNKTPPYIYGKDGKKFKLRTLLDDSGWVITRVI